MDVPGVSCEKAFRAPFFRDYIQFQHTLGGVDNIYLRQDGDVGQVYQLEFAGVNVSLFVDYEEDAPLTVDVELVDGFNFFDAYHEHWDFQTLPGKYEDDANCRKVRVEHGKHRHYNEKSPANGCRIMHSFIAIFSEEAPVTRDQWYAAADGEAAVLYDLLTQGDSEA